LDPELGNINADPGQIEQVIMNLTVNARDAMPVGGTLTIQTQNVYLDKDYMSEHIATSAGPFVKMTVTDTGEGMDEKTQKRIFEPFFTTKEVGNGTGLGLSTVFGIVKQSGGDIVVYSEIGHGTTFKIYFPRVDESVQKVKWPDDAKGDLKGTETILLVEDEEIVRNLVREVLTNNGYHVLEADNGKAAVSIVKTYLEPIHLLLADVIMPGMSCRTMKDAIVKLRPDIKVLFMSGYTDDSIASKGMFDSGTAFIEKPFSPEALARKIREILTG
jgi:CheY-like chemotaxis protein